MSVFNTVPLLSFIIFLPILGAIFIFFVQEALGQSHKNSKNAALFITLTTFILSLILWYNFDSYKSDYQFVEDNVWISGLNVRYHLGVDGISLFFVLLTTFLMPICILASWNSIKVRVKDYLIIFLLLETFILGAFCSLDLLLFYVFFEATLIPMFLIIGIWGGTLRVYAAFKFFLYTLTGSVLMLLAILYLYFELGTTSIPILTLYSFNPSQQAWLWLAFFASFAVKIPMWPFHTWLPDAHVEAPTAGSVVLAGILLKMGAYGFLRVSLPFFPEASTMFAPYVCILSVIGIIYTSLIALVQRDMKKLIAYSSIAHMGFVTLGIFTFLPTGFEGSLVQMLSHGVISAALFLCVGFLYEREHSREINHYGGLLERMPIFGVFFMIFTLGAIGLPGTSGFIGEFLVILSAFQVNSGIATFAGIGTVLSAAYMLWLYRRLMFGKIEESKLTKVKDLSSREIFIFMPLVIIIFWIGIYPTSFMEEMHQPVSSLLEYLGRDPIESPEGSFSIMKKESVVGSKQIGENSEIRNPKKSFVGVLS